jgi:hypothetical protein
MVRPQQLPRLKEKEINPMLPTLNLQVHPKEGRLSIIYFKK